MAIPHNITTHEIKTKIRKAPRKRICPLRTHLQAEILRNLPQEAQRGKHGPLRPLRRRLPHPLPQHAGRPQGGLDVQPMLFGRVTSQTGSADAQEAG